jgi:hypothetical protein
VERQPKGEFWRANLIQNGTIFLEKAEMGGRFGEVNQ